MQAACLLEGKKRATPKNQKGAHTPTSLKK
jgi:hypothetical protein